MYADDDDDVNIILVTLYIYIYISIYSQAFETKSTLMSQRASLQGSATGITGLVANVPSFQRLIEGVQRKKTRETMLVSLFVGVLLCFTIWYVMILLL